MRSAFTHWKKCVVAVAFLAALAAAGCGSKDGEIPTASIEAGAPSGTASTVLQEKPRFNLHPVVQVKTSIGEFTVKLDSEHAPLSVDNFLAYANAGHYDGTIFHQVYDGFIALGGGYDAQFVQKQVQTPVRNEAHNGLKNRRGTITLARQADDIDSATSQFFINLADNASLDYLGPETSQYGYCVFGEVTAGMDVVERIGKAPVQNNANFDNVPVQPVVIESVRRVK